MLYVQVYCKEAGERSDLAYRITYRVGNSIDLVMGNSFTGFLQEGEKQFFSLSILNVFLLFLFLFLLFIRKN